MGHVLGGLGSPPISEGRAAQKSGEAVVSPGVSIEVGEPDSTSAASSSGWWARPPRAATTSGSRPCSCRCTTPRTSCSRVSRSRWGSRSRAAHARAGGDDGAHQRSRWSSDLNRPLAGGVQSIVVMAVLMWLIAAGIIGLIVYLSAIERMRDFAVFKATGAPTRIIVGGLMLQAVIVSLVAAVVAIGVSKLVGLGLPFPSELGAAGIVQLVRDQPRRRRAREPRRGAARAHDRPRRRVRGEVMPDIRVRDLTMEYSSGGYVVRPFDHFDLDLATGNLALLLGASGCGKTTLLSMLASILTPTSGSIHVGDIEVTALKGADLAAYRRRTVGVVFQAFNLIPSLTAQENIYVAMRYAGVGRKAAKSRSEELLAMVGLEDRMHHRPGKLSGGQQQRVAIARALALDPPLIVADEPTASLDYVQVDGVIRLLRELAAPGRVVVIATHDERLLAARRPGGRAHAASLERVASARPGRARGGGGAVPPGRRPGTWSTRWTRAASTSSRSCPTAARTCSRSSNPATTSASWPRCSGCGARRPHGQRGRAGGRHRLHLARLPRPPRRGHAHRGARSRSRQRNQASVGSGSADLAEVHDVPLAAPRDERRHRERVGLPVLGVLQGGAVHPPVRQLVGLLARLYEHSL